MVGINRKELHNPGNARLLKMQGGACFYCQKPLKAAKATQDHLVPKASGRGLHANKVLACGPCNVRKGCKAPTGWDVERARSLYRKCGIPRLAVG